MNNTDPEVFSAILRLDFHSFLRQCFTTLYPGSTFLDNWHLHVLADELAAVARGENRRLIVNMPPRSLKSVATSVALIAWYLGHNPGAEVICASYSADLSQKFAFDCRKDHDQRLVRGHVSDARGPAQIGRARFPDHPGRRTPRGVGWRTDDRTWR
jgi:hypothetical protein